MSCGPTLDRKSTCKTRFDQRKPTILISNLPLGDVDGRPGLKRFLGDAIWDRLYCASGDGRFILRFSGESYRPSHGDEYLAGLR